MHLIFDDECLSLIISKSTATKVTKGIFLLDVQLDVTAENLLQFLDNNFFSPKATVMLKSLKVTRQYELELNPNFNVISTADFYYTGFYHTPRNTYVLIKIRDFIEL